MIDYVLTVAVGLVAISVIYVLSFVRELNNRQTALEQALRAPSFAPSVVLTTIDTYRHD